MRNRSLLLIITMVCIVLAACALGGCTNSTNTTTPQATAVTSTAAQSTPTTAPASGTFTTGVTPTDTGYIVKGNTATYPQGVKLTLKAGTYTFHIKLFDFSKEMSGQAFLQGTGAIAENQVMLIVFTDPAWGADMTVTKKVPADGDYKLHVSYLNNWEVDISQ